jgi:beta-glucosidase
MLKRFRFYGASTPEVSQREWDHRALAQEAAAEGMVLLENNGVLPLTPGKIGLFGSGARMTVQGGSGSGETRGRGNISIEQGLLNAGFTFPNKRNMDRFEQHYHDRIAAWKADLDEKANKYSPIRTMDMFIMIGEHHKPVPRCAPILPDELTDETDTAIYVLSRQAGEGGDRKAEKGDYYLSDTERENLRLLSETHKKLILVINTGGVVDLSILEEIRIDAVILYGQPGVSGGAALAAILTGQVTPSGHLTDTWAMDYYDYPSARTYSHINGETNFENYFEGSYVGYRYFSSFGVKPRYSFGYGLSYTSFDISAESIKVKKTVVTIAARVKNIGNRQGKEVVQLYLDGELVAFAKTKTLEPEEEQTLSLTFDLAKLGSFDENRHAFILHAGEYGLALGNQFTDAVFAVLALNQEVVTEEVPIITSKPDFEDMKAEKMTAFPESLPRYAVNAADFVILRHETFQPKFSEKVKSVLSRLSDKDKIALVVGGGYSIRSFNNVMGAAGRTATNLLKKGIPNVMFSDGPAGLNVIPEMVFMRDGTPRFLNGLPEEWQWGWLKKMSRLVTAKPDKGRPVYHYMTCWPCATLQAQSWNTPLVERIGKAVGTEMLEIGVSVWLAPGMNIHRNPLCGRNFEYYSEDPLISGKMASSVVLGCPSSTSVATIKKKIACWFPKTYRKRHCGKSIFGHSVLLWKKVNPGP